MFIYTEYNIHYDEPAHIFTFANLCIFVTYFVQESDSELKAHLLSAPLLIQTCFTSTE